MFYLDLENTDYLYGIAHQIFKKVKYPCLLVMCYQNKFLCSCCRIAAGKIDYDNNILGRICFSHWIHPDLLTDKSQNMLSEINQALNLKSNLYDIYIKMAHAIESFKLSGISRAHVDRLLQDMLGKTPASKRDEIMQYCTPYKKFVPRNGTQAAKFEKEKNHYEFRYDSEDIWYCLLKNEKTRKVISGRRYRDIEDLIISIDTKLQS